MRQRKKIFLILLAGTVLMASCAPKVVGKRKHKKIRGCGCEQLRPHQVSADSCTAFTIDFQYELQH